MSFNPQYKETPDTMTDGQRTTGVVDALGRLLVSTGGDVVGSTDDAAWNGTDADATVISLLKKIALNTVV